MQNRRAIFFLLLAVILGVGAAFTAQRWLEQQSQAPTASGEKPKTQPVTVVRQDTAVGSLLKERELATVEWPIEFVPQGAYSKPSQLEGRVIRRPLSAGEPVLESALLPEGAQGGLVSVIDPSQRAVSVRVDQVIGVAGFVTPGASVDVLTTLKRDSDAKVFSKIVLQDVQVLAIDQKLEESNEGEPHLVQVVTLEVSPEQSEKLTYVSHNGKLQLALRNPSDREVLDTRSVSFDEIMGVRRQTPARPRAVSTTNVEVIKGAQLSVETF
jgi:pilus assembly protein CpaB